MTPRRVRMALVLAGFSLLVPASVRGQFDSGQIAGFVRDTSGAVISGATVLAMNEGNLDERRAATNESGHYVLPNLPVGTYTISSEAPGFSKFVRSGIKLSAADRLSVDIELAVGSVTQTVEVKGSSLGIQTESAQVSRTVESRQIQDLTLNGRNPIFFGVAQARCSGRLDRQLPARRRDQRRLQH